MSRMRRFWSVAVVLGVLAAGQLQLLHVIGDGLTSARIGDPYSEADAFRAAGYYAAFGLSSNAGLPNIVAFDRFRDEGWVADQRSARKDSDAYPLPHGVYTRYPPTPMMMLAIAERIVGYHPQYFRIIPLSLGLLALGLFGVEFLRHHATMSGHIGILLLGAVPLTFSHMSAVHYQGYALALYLVECTVVLRAMRGHTRALLPQLGVLGFLQGCFSFDYLFIATLTPALLPLSVWPDMHGSAPAWGRRAVLIVGATFLLAVALHFLQVVVFYGNIDAALSDWLDRARYRMTVVKGSDFPNVRLQGFSTYTRQFFGLGTRHFGGQPLIIGSLVALFCVRRVRQVGLTALRPLAVVLACFSCSMLWVAFMPGMSVKHTHFIPRIFILPYLALLFALVTLLQSWIVERFGAPMAPPRA